VISNAAKSTREMKCSIALGKGAFKKKKYLLTRKLELNIRKKGIKCCIWALMAMVLKNGNFGK
jgi:hypothetical protein